MRFQCVKFFCPKIGSCKFFDKFQVCLLGFGLVLRSSLWQYCSKRRLWGRQAVISSLKQKGWNYGKWMITWYKQKFLEIGLARITSYQASLPGSVEVVRVMYGALATQVFLIENTDAWVSYLSCKVEWFIWIICSKQVMIIDIYQENTVLLGTTERRGGMGQLSFLMWMRS